MAQTKKLLVAFDPSKAQSQSSDFVVPVKAEGRTRFYGLKSGVVQSLGMMVYVGRSVTENDLFAKLVDTGAKVESVDETLAQLRQYIEALQDLRIGNVVRLQECNGGNVELELASNTPSGFAKQQGQAE